MTRIASLLRAVQKAHVHTHPTYTPSLLPSTPATVQKAYETLSDERKRRAYDSEMDFDESIPTGRERGDFFKVRCPVIAGCRVDRWMGGR